MQLYFFIILIIFILIVIKNCVLYINRTKIIYTECLINKMFLADNYFIPLCYIDRKKNILYLYGYFKSKNQKKYHYRNIILQIANSSNSFSNSMKISLVDHFINKKKLSLCIVSIFHNINIKNLIRTILLYKSIGVDHATLYLSNYNQVYKKYIDWLKTQLWIEIINYTYPNISFFYYGQDSKLNHCVNHYRYISDYVIITDIDEIIIPQQNISIIDILQKYGCENFVFSFKSVAYMVNNIRSSIFNSSKEGCIIYSGYEKMILRPEKIISIGAHFPKIWKEKGKIVFINISDGYVRHARVGKKRLNCTIVRETESINNLKIDTEYKLKYI